MHIVFFEFVTTYGGARRSTIEVAARLSKHVRVTIVDPYGCCPKWVYAVGASGVELRVLKKQEAKIVGGARESIIKRVACLVRAFPNLVDVRQRLSEVVSELRPTVICCNETKGMALATTVAGPPVVAYMRGWYRPNDLVPYVRHVLRHRVDHLIAVSNATRAALACNKISWNKISVLPNPVDIPALEKQAEQTPSINLPQRERPVRMLMAANILREKGQHVAIDALARLLAQGCDACLYIAGEVPFSSPSSYVSELESQALRLGVGDRVVFLGFRNDVPALIRASTVVVLPTDYPEGMPRILLESMALGVPVVSTPVSGNTDVILHGVTGLFAEPNDPEGLARAVKRIADNPIEAKWMAANAKNNMQEQHSPGLHTQRLLDLFSRLGKLGGRLRDRRMTLA